MNKEIKNNNKRILQLDGIRFIMALYIFYAHLDFISGIKSIGPFYDFFSDRAVIAVEFFFLLSGFGVYFSNKNSECTIKKSVSFALTKIKKIYPAYIFSLVIGFFYQIPYWVNGNHNNYHPIIYLAEFLFAIVFALMLIQSLTGMDAFSHALNSPCWFLSSVFISYMFCPLFSKIVDKTNGIKAILIRIVESLAIIYLLSYISLTIEKTIPNGLINTLYFCHPFIRCFYLLIGMYCAKIVQLIREKNIHNNIEIITIVLFLVYFYFRNVVFCDDTIIRIFDIISLSFLIIILSICDGPISKILKNDRLIKLSKYSMYIFLIHYPVRKIIYNILEKYIRLHYYFGDYAYFIQIILIIIFTYLLIKICIKVEPKIRKYTDPLIEKLIFVINK